MKVFLDTNILVDVIENREGTIIAKHILQYGRNGLLELFASYLSYTNINYIKRDCERSLRYEMLRRLRQGITVLPCDSSQLDAALSHADVRDFEDLLQYQCAVAGGCDVIVTNNTKDYREFCNIPFMSSRDFLLQYFIQAEKEE